MTQKPPQLKDISQCSKVLDFSPYSPWPMGLPAVAVNGVVLAGFAQTVVFDHQVDFADQESVASLFRSFYSELTAVELAKLAQKASENGLAWFPIELVFSKFQVRWSEQTEKICRVISKAPMGLQKFAAEKRWSVGDFSPLLSAQALRLEPLFHIFIERNLSRSLSVQALELYVELLLLGTVEAEILPRPQEDSDLWLKRLRVLRYPQSAKADELAGAQLKDLPWPGTSTARWTRQGDKAGIELKLFVANPMDLKKYVQSLALVSEAMEKEGPWKKH